MGLMARALTAEPGCVANDEQSLRDRFAEGVCDSGAQKGLRRELKTRIRQDPELTFLGIKL
jgi:hypothetical protein